MNDILSLPEWVVISKKETGTTLQIEAEYTVMPTACQKCGVIGRLYRHGVKAQTFIDSPIREHTVTILAQVQRYKCRDCGGTFPQPLGGIQDSMRMTERCAAFIKRQSLSRPFVDIAKLVGCDDKTVRTLAADHIAVLSANYKPKLPAWLGIDETQIDGVLRLVITDVKARRPVDMLPDRDSKSLATWLGHFKDRSHVKVVTTDMHRPYARVVEALLPGVPLVVDKFHVVRMANTGLDDVRNRLAASQPKDVGREWKRHKGLLRMRRKNLTEKGRFNLDMWLDNDPEVAIAYRLKESFYDIYEAKTKDEARRLMSQWRETVPANMRKPGRKEFAPLMSITKNWPEQILAYWDYRVTNAYTESFNGVAKVVNRLGRGYSFDVLRARVLFGSEPATKGKAAVDPMQKLREHVKGLVESMKASPLDCPSCGAPLGKAGLAMGPKPKNSKLKYSFICTACHERFHKAGWL